MTIKISFEVKQLRTVCTAGALMVCTGALMVCTTMKGSVGFTSLCVWLRTAGAEFPIQLIIVDCREFAIKMCQPRLTCSLFTSQQSLD